ncbi:H-2 class I histocompatibility Q10 alpha chain-like isoform X2 [Labeo rohita]|uniref:H-2 class I histocompatibility Q10 alpha chain-like isoform X2 n=1 Tax=Labeo rohita TaxID=84645 RepID=A0A498P2S2_LABRO|nr:H-2 class I histocompatibility Q10 alpha chain-like isoform X2 [Labeo rohita]
MCTSVTTKIFALLCVFLLNGTLASVQAERHSLYSIHTGLSKPVNLPGIYQFTAMGLLDGRQINYYNSKTQRMISKQQWMNDKMDQDYWEIGTQLSKSKEQWFNVNIDILMELMGHDESDLHVLQVINGCEVKMEGDKLKFSQGIRQYGYDGVDFLYFDIKASQWIAFVNAAVPIKREWNDMPHVNLNIKAYLIRLCVAWLIIVREYANEELRNASPPDVYVFANMYISDKTKLKLTCMATGFYSKDVIMTIRKNRTPVPEDEIDSTQIRPNEDGTFQQTKSVEINKDDEVDCFVSHRNSKEPIIIKWDGKCQNCPPEVVAVLFGSVIGGVLFVVILYVVVSILKKKKSTVDCPTHTSTVQMDEIPTEQDTAGGSDVSSTDYWDDVNQEYEDSRHRLAAVSTEALIQEDDL